MSFFNILICVLLSMLVYLIFTSIILFVVYKVLDRKRKKTLQAFNSKLNRKV